MNAGGNGADASSSRNGAGAIAPPPLPPRPNESAVAPYMPQQGVFSAGYGYGASPYGYGGFGTYGSTPYSGYSYGGYGAGRPLQSCADSDFVRIAEQQSRHTMQSLETFVGTVSSVSMMLESSLSAVLAAWRAALFVADQGHKARAQLAGLIRGTLNLLKKIAAWLMVALRLRPANYYRSIDDAWLNASAGAPESFGGGSRPGALGSRPTFASMLVLAVAVGGPWLLYKLIAKVVEDVEQSRQWAHGVGEHYEAVALFSFTAASQAELSVQAGDRLRIAPKQQQPAVRGWILASAMAEPGDLQSTGEAHTPRIGLVPLNYVRLVDRRHGEPATRNDSFTQQWSNAANTLNHSYSNAALPHYPSN